MNKIQLFLLRIKGTIDSLKKQQKELDKKIEKGTLRKSPHSEKELQKELSDFIAGDSFKTVFNFSNEDIVVKDAFGKNIVIKSGEAKKINWIGQSIK